MELLVHGIAGKVGTLLGCGLLIISGMAIIPGAGTGWYGTGWHESDDEDEEHI